MKNKITMESEDVQEYSIEQLQEMDFTNLPTRELLRMWRVPKDILDNLAKEREHIEKIEIALKNAVDASLFIPEDKEESEKVSISGVGYCSKRLVPVLKVFDWDALKRWSTEKNWTSITRNQANLAPVQDLQEAIFAGLVTLPSEIAEIVPISKLTIRKR